MKMPNPDDIDPAEFKLAVDKTEEFFEQLTWKFLKAQTTVDTTDKAWKLAAVIAEVGDQVKEKLGVSEDDWAKMLIMGGCSILAAGKHVQEKREAKRRAEWN